MRPLEDMSLGHRIALSVIIVLAILFALALVGYLSGRWEAEAAPQVDLYGGVPPDAKLLPVDRKALDDAYHAHLIRLWNVWLSDGAKDATNFRRGLVIARGAYQQATQSMDKREQDLEQQK
jgi:hypothetical protein